MELLARSLLRIALCGDRFRREPLRFASSPFGPRRVAAFDSTSTPTDSEDTVQLHRVIAVATVAGALAACGGSARTPEEPDTYGEGPMEEAGEEIDEAAEDTGDATEEAVDDTGDALEEAGDEIEEETEDAD
jgi:hypothetical protein